MGDGLELSGASENFDTGGYAYDGAGNVTKMGSERYVYDLLSRIGEAQLEVPDTGCGEELGLDSGTDSGTITHQSCGTVRAEGSYQVGAGGNVTLKVGHRVILGDGFSVASGGRLTAEIDPALDPVGQPEETSQSYTYDLFGNLLSVTTQPEGESPVTRTIGTNSSTNRLSVATYDTSGNVTVWAGREYRYDPFNMLWQTKPTGGNGVSFVYGPGDERLWTIDWSAGSAPSNWRETWTLRDLDGAPLRQFRQQGGNLDTGDWSFHRDYVYRGGALLAAHTPEGRRHFHLDHLGSPRLITDTAGQTLAQHLYFPFGEETTNAAQNDEALKFTGHERDDLDAGGSTADLDYMMARYFSAHLGRFHSVDALGGAPELPQSWNRYAYVLDNSVNYIDPSGLQVATFGGELTVIGQILPLGSIPLPQSYFNFLSFGAFLRNLNLWQLLSPAARPTWDPITDQRINQLHPCAQSRARALVNLAEDQLSLTLRVSAGFRSLRDQAREFAKGRTAPGSIVTYARPGQSYHNYGLAIDVAPISGGQLDYNINWGGVGTLGESLGFEWGGRWNNPDRPHFQLTLGRTTSQLQALTSQQLQNVACP